MPAAGMGNAGSRHTVWERTPEFAKNVAVQEKVYDSRQVHNSTWTQPFSAVHMWPKLKYRGTKEVRFQWSVGAALQWFESWLVIRGGCKHRSNHMCYFRCNALANLIDRISCQMLLFHVIKRDVVRHVIHHVMCRRYDVDDVWKCDIM